MTPEDVRAAFTLPDGGYRFARWRRPIAPVVFGVDDATLAILKHALTEAARAAGHPLAETDPDQGANLMIFFARDWAEVGGVPDLDGLVPGMVARLPKLAAEGASQYIHMRFEPDGAIRAAISFVVLTGGTAEMGAGDLARALAQRLMLAWAVPPQGDAARVLAAAYDPVLPDATQDPVHALRVGARVGHGL
jgi:hypothetical protein